MKVLSLDIAFRYTGLSIWEDNVLKRTGIISIDRKKQLITLDFSDFSLPNRVTYAVIYSYSRYKSYEILEIVKAYKNLLQLYLPKKSFDTIVGETSFFGFQSASASTYLSIASTIYMCFYEDKFTIVRPYDVKKVVHDSLSNKDALTKQDIQNWVLSTIQLDKQVFIPKQKYLNEHIYDSIATYLVYSKNK